MNIRCKKQYFNNHVSTVPLTDTIYGVVDTDAKTIELFFPYPFLIIGIGNTKSNWNTTPLPDSEIPMLYTTGIDIVYTTNNYDLLMQLFTVMMYANRDVDNYSNSPFKGAIQYQEHLLAKYKNYFEWFLSRTLKDIFYPQFLWPMEYVRQFWIETAINTPPYYYEEIRKLIRDLFNNSDRRMWGAPGKYIIYYGAVPSGEPVTPELEYQNYSS